MHQRVYEGTLHWPLNIRATCEASKTEPPYPGAPPEGPAADPCGHRLSLDADGEPVTIADLISVLEGHMRDEHGEQV